MDDGAGDEVIDRLAALFRSHPAWVEAAGHISPRAASSVYFSHRPGDVWHLEQRDGETLLLPRAASQPDFVFRFSPGAVDRLEAVEGGIGDFAVELFTLMTEAEPDEAVDLRIVSGFARLIGRGYVRLLLAAGPRVVSFGASHGIRTLNGLRRFVSGLRSRGPADWEVSGGSDPTNCS